MALLAACNESGNSSSPPQAPKPGFDHLPQIYVLLDGATAAWKEHWAFPDTKALPDQMTARVESARVSSLPEALETLKVWNARPVDLLILGPGFPQDAWLSETLPRVESRVVLAIVVGDKQPKLRDARVVRVSESLVQESLKEFCEGFLKSSCATLPKTKLGGGDAAKAPLVSLGRARENDDTGRPIYLNLVLQWPEFLRFVLNLKQSRFVADSFALDFASGFLELKKGSAYVSSAAEKQKFDDFLKLWRLRQVEAGSRLGP